METALAAQKAEQEEEQAAFEQDTIAHVSTRLEQELHQKLSQYKAQTAQDLDHKVQKLTQLTEQVSQLQKALQAGQVSRLCSRKAHQSSAAALALAQVLQTSRGAGPELQALQFAAGTKGIIANALATLDAIKSRCANSSRIARALC
jgi:hypothetical protein